MLEFELERADGRLTTYGYSCEGDKNRRGRLVFDKVMGDVESVEKAPNDDFGFYWPHLASALRSMSSRESFDSHGMIAWY